MVDKGDIFFLSSNTKASDLECKEAAIPRDSSMAGLGRWLASQTLPTPL